MSVNTIIQLMHSYKISYLLFYATEKGIFDLLQKPMTVEEVSHHLENVPPNKLGIILNVLAGLGLLNAVDGTYWLKDEYSGLLVENSKQSTLHLLKLEKHLMQNHNTYEALVEALETNEAKDNFNLHRKEGMEGTYGDAMENGGHMAAIYVARAFRCIGKENPCILDIGGGKGSYAISVNRCIPGASVDIYERPEMEKVCKENIEKEGLKGMVQFIPIDVTKECIHKKYDGILLSNLLHLFEVQTIVTVLKKCAQALNDDGVLIVHDFFLDNNHTGPLTPLLFTLDWLMIGAGFNFSAEDVQDICRPFGLQLTEKKSYSAIPTSIVVFKKNREKRL